ncbi:MAG: AAA family ATPase [Thermoguttaceae bacterium]|nr:AAA family ATPase [Thermoguttaceae bacterium]MDO4858187.1 AAA family ATPase [Thermoguttaceae bacterium]
MTPYGMFDNDEDLRRQDDEEEERLLQKHREELIRERALTPFTFSQMENFELPEPDILIDPILRSGESMIISARAGVGKTFLSLMMAKALTEGVKLFGRWDVPKFRKVLYLDGEMGIIAMRQRMNDLGIFSPKFQLIPCDWPPERISLNLFNADDQFLVENAIQTHKPDVLFLDNLSTLYKVDRTNQMESWIVMQTFILRVRSRGVAVVLVDHNGKIEGNGPRGTSAKSDIMHTIIELRRPFDYTEDQGARFVMTFTKHRSFCGEHAKTVEAWLKDNEWKITVGENTIKTQIPQKDRRRERKEMFADLFQRGMNHVAAYNYWKVEHPEDPVSERTFRRYYNEWRLNKKMEQAMIGLEE